MEKAILPFDICEIPLYHIECTSTFSKNEQVEPYAIRERTLLKTSVKALMEIPQ